MDTIAAIATPAGYGGIAVIRVSGTKALDICSRSFAPRRRRPLDCSDDRRVVLGEVRRGSQTIDRCVASLFLGPNSYTGENVVELACHGSPFVASHVLDTLLENGARLAEPGEFTRRAFENGKLDLVQAEAVLDLILAHGEQSARLALSQLSGQLSRRIEGFQQELITAVAEIQAFLEFPDEDLSTETPQALLTRLKTTSKGIEELLETYDEGRQIQQGYSCVLVGDVNVGKSTLANALLGAERSIVTPLPGTTRDLVESRLKLQGISVLLYDTAGLRNSECPVEAEGVRRTLGAVSSADLAILVIDAAAKDPGWEDRLLFEKATQPKQHCIVAWNKVDLRHDPPPGEFLGIPVVPVSALTGTGLEELRHQIKKILLTQHTSSGERLLLSNTRQKNALQRAHKAMARAMEILPSRGDYELAVEDLQVALTEFGRVLGKVTPDEILDQVFSRFCIGK